MPVAAPPAPAQPGVHELEEIERLEALIEEARGRARRRRRWYAAWATLAVGAGTAIGAGVVRSADDGAVVASSSNVPLVEIKLAGARLAYVPPPGTTLYVTNPDGSGARRLAACPPSAPCTIRDPVWSPDGLRVAFLRGRPVSPNNGGTLALYVIGLDGRGERRLASCGDSGCGAAEGSRLAWSPDGAEIAFSRGRSIAVVDVASGRLRPLTMCRLKSCTDTGPAWSPDGAAIAFTRNGALYRVGVFGGRLTFLATEGYNAAWARDGRTILVDTRRGVLSVATDERRATLLVSGIPGNGPGLPRWSPDGSRVLYFWTPRSPRGYRAEVWTMQPDGSGKRRLYRGPCCIGGWFRPAWSPDGSRVVLSADHFPANRGSTGGTLVVGADGSGLRNLSRYPTDIDWQPTITPGPGSDTP